MFNNPNLAALVQQQTRAMGQNPFAGPGATSQWGQLNGRLIGDTYLPSDVSTVDVGKGWYEVHHGGQRVGTLRPGGSNGRFINDTGWDMPQPGLAGGVPTSARPQPGMPMSHTGFMSSGPYGNQAAQMAGLLAQPQQPMQQMPPQQMGGLLGGGPKGFRIPGK